MALLQIRRGNNGTKGTLQYGEPFFNSTLQTVQFGASGSEEITLVKLNTGLLTYLISNGMDSEYQKIINEYISKNIIINDIWLKFNNETNVLP